MEYSNSQKLAAVVSEWARPAISQIATNKITSVNAIKSVQNSLISTGLVGQNYSFASEIMPFMNNAVNILIEPMLNKYFSQIPDESLPHLAHSVVDTAMQQPKFSFMDGLIEFDQNDMIELKDLLEKNLPISAQREGYKIIK